MQPSVFVHCVHVSPTDMKVRNSWIARKNIVRAAKTPFVLFPIYHPWIYIIYNKCRAGASPRPVLILLPPAYSQ